jgi:transcriptional regulator with XRE-family HTH domain
MDLGKRIKEIRLAKGLKQSDICQMIGMEQAHYSRLENRGNNLNFEFAVSIAKTLGVSLKELIFGDEPSEQEQEIDFLERELELAKAEIRLLINTLDWEREGITKNAMKRDIIKFLYLLYHLRIETPHFKIRYRVSLFRLINEETDRLELQLFYELKIQTGKVVKKSLKTLATFKNDFIIDDPFLIEVKIDNSKALVLAYNSLNTIGNRDNWEVDLHNLFVFFAFIEESNPLWFDLDTNFNII